MDFSPQLADRLANAAMGWYSNCLTDAELVEQIEGFLRQFGQSELVLPPDICADILASRPGAHPMRFQIDVSDLPGE
jgi:hypothetical protein